MYWQETTLKKKLKSKKKKKLVKVKKGEKDHEEGNEQEDEEEGDSHEGEQENAVHREKASSALIPPKKGQPKRQREVKKENLDMPESPDNDKKELKG